MEPVTIKPHHFMDIIKLYGGGLERFMPDPAMGHDFYRIANLVLENPELPLRLTTEGDDICKPCKYYAGRCSDLISHIPGITEKDSYNKLLDSRILKLFHLAGPGYTPRTLCQALYRQRSLIFDVWKEENREAAEKRYALFSAGAERYLKERCQE